jgi:hypothetical protein
MDRHGTRIVGWRFNVLREGVSGEVVWVHMRARDDAGWDGRS